MNCLNCGFEVEPEDSVCKNCKQNPRISILPPEENENFTGLTIEQDLNNQQKEFNHNDPRIFIRRIQFGTGKNNFLFYFFIAIMLLLLAVIALPLFLVIIGLFLISMVFGKRNH